MDRPQRSHLLAIDSGANYLLGLPLLVVPRSTAKWLGVPDEQTTFYRRVLGGVLTGVATALAIEHGRKAESDPVGLGAAGAVAINGLGGAVVALWLAMSPDAAAIPRRGRVLLWGVSSGVLVLGAIETYVTSAPVTVGRGTFRGSSHGRPRRS